MTLGASISLKSFQQLMIAKQIAAYKEGAGLRQPKQLIKK